MDHVLPAGKVFQAGTLSGNPLATAAGIATLQDAPRRRIALPAAWSGSRARLAAGLDAAATRGRRPAHRRPRAAR